MSAPKGWVEVWDKEGTESRFVDPATAKSMLVSERFSDKPFPAEGEDAATETKPASAPGKPAVATTTSAPVDTPLPAQG